MHPRRFHCRKVLLDGGWSKDRLLETDEQGMLVGISDAGGQTADQVIEGPVIPGMPNVHSHAFQRLMAGLTGARSQNADDFWGWREAMYGFANRITPGQIEDCAAWLYAEMLCAGYTSCGEFHYLHHQPGGQPYDNRAEASERLLAAAVASGISLTVLPVFYHVSGFGKDTVEPHQRRFANGLDEYLSLLEQVRSLADATPMMSSGLAPHSLRAVSPESLLSLLRMSDEQQPVHIHVAEQLAEVEGCLAHLGARPVEWLLHNARVDRRWCLVHATHMEMSELQGAAGSGAIAGLCPTTEADLGDGFFGSREWLQAGGRFGVGSDSNLIISPAEELRLLEFSERLRSHGRNVLQDGKSQCGAFLWQAAARHGASAIAQPAGCISIGKRADLVELDPEHPMLAERGDEAILETLVFAGQAGMVRSVWVGGSQCVSNGRHADHERLAANFIRASKELQA